MRKELLAVLLCALVVAGFGIGYLVGVNNRLLTSHAVIRTATLTSTQTTTTVSQNDYTFTSTEVSSKNYTTTITITETGSSGSSTVSSASEMASYLSANGLELVVSITPPSQGGGLSLNVTVSIVNTRPVNITIFPSDDWLFEGVPLYFWQPCLGGPGVLSFGLPVQVAVLNGTYQAQDLPLVADTIVHPLPVCMENTDINSATFQPRSDTANLSTTNWLGENSSEIDSFRFSFITGGYWNLKALAADEPMLGPEMYANPPSTPTAITFTPGGYTVAVEDEWGQAVVLHFTVPPSP